MALSYQIREIAAIHDKIRPAVKAATGAVATIISNELTRRLAALKHAQQVQDVFNLEGEPRPHLFQTVNSKVVKRRDGDGFIAVVGCRKVGAHISIINSGTTKRERKPREFTLDINTTPLKLLGSRAGGRGGIAGHFVWVELLIRRGLVSPNKRTTGTGPQLNVLGETLASTRTALDSAVVTALQGVINSP